MKKFALGLLVGLVLAGLTVVVLIFSAMRMGERRPTVSDGSTLILKLEGGIPEKAPVEISLPFFDSPSPLTVHDVWLTLRKAAADKRVKAVILMPQGLDAGWAKLNEIRDSVTQFRKSGKPIWVYLRAPGMREYYLAAASDRIYISPEDLLDLKGLRAELLYLKNTLDKLGAQMEVQHIGKYKDALDTLTQTGPSPETLEVMNSILDNVYGQVTQSFAEGRKKTPEQIRALLDRGPFTAEQALAHGLVDSLRFEDQVYGEMKDHLKQGELKKVGHREYLRVSARSLGLEGKNSIALMVGEGAISRGGGEDAMGSDDAFSSAAFVRMIRKVANDGSIKGVILRVDSPGGDAVASDEILREMKLLSKKKPLVVSMSDAAASGGYYVAMTGDPIIAYPATFTGSIGIVYGKPNLRGLYDKLGISKEILTRGANAAIDTDYRPMTDAGRAKLRDVLEDFYKGFVTKAAESRKRKYEEVEPLAQGRVWLGSQAKANGLIDELGGLDRAIEMVKKKANIPAGENVRIVPYPPKRNIFDQYLKSANSDNVVESKLRSVFGGFDYKLWMRGGLMRVMPYSIEIK